MAGENQQTTQSDAFALLQQLLSGGGSTVGQNSVYLGGTSGTKQVKMKKTGQTINIPVPKVSTIQEANALYLTDPKLQSNWRKTMQKYGMETGNPIIERKAWEVAVAGASDWYATSNGTAKVTPEQYLAWYAGGQKKGAENLPSRSVYQYSPEQIGAKIDETAQSLLGRAITNADKSASWYKDLNKALNDMVMQGTVTTSKKVKNPKTGKMENVTIQKPEVTAEALQQKIAGALEAADPASLERKKNLDFEKWFLSMKGKVNG
jgi:hypothetical protein